MIEVEMRMRAFLSFVFLVCGAWTAWADFEVYFMRHGETAWNRAMILQGSTSNTVLTACGVEMAVRSAEKLHSLGIAFDRIYASPYLRSWRTAEIVAPKVGGSPIADARLREMCFGRYEGVRYAKGAWPDDNLRRFFEDPETYVPQGAGAESYEQVQTRLRDFLERELRPLDGKVTRVLCVAHSLVLKALVRELAGEAATDAAKAPLQRNCSVHVVRFSHGVFTLQGCGLDFYDPAAFAGRPRLVAHRGAADLTMPEASRPAYSNAVAGASDIVKLDLRRTKDGVIVLGHDPTLKRNMGWDVRIQDLTYAEILEKGVFCARGGYANERIVRLDEALEILRLAPEFWIDFKHFDPEFAERVLRTFRTAGIDESRIMVATFSRPALEYMAGRHPNVRRVAHVSLKCLEDGTWASNLGPGGTREAVVKGLLSGRDALGLFGVNMPVGKGQTRPEDVRYLHENGLWVSLWFVQDAAKAAQYGACMPDAFVTDHASTVRSWNDSLPIKLKGDRPPDGKCGKCSFRHISAR